MNLSVAIAPYNGHVPEGRQASDFVMLTLTGAPQETFGMTVTNGTAYMLVAMPIPGFFDGVQAATLAPNPEDALKQTLAKIVKASQMVLVVERKDLTGEQRQVADALYPECVDEDTQPVKLSAIRPDLTKFVKPSEEVEDN
jgi:hypothetical protein